MGGLSPLESAPITLTRACILEDWKVDGWVKHTSSLQVIECWTWKAMSRCVSFADLTRSETWIAPVGDFMPWSASSLVLLLIGPMGDSGLRSHEGIRPLLCDRASAAER